ncbi:MAG: YkgJ family cysteine cluster protein, partial [Rhodospirillaceae bacterium]|nr:YkgJ family cysteine cluster protein [Rhodospirillaceae bacterium]
TPMERAAAVIARAAEVQRRATGKALTGKRSISRLLAMTRDAMARVERTIARVNKIAPPARPIACGANCPFCCHIRLMVSPPEILAVADHLRKSLGEDDLAKTKLRVANLDHLTRGHGEARREAMRLPCSMLVDGSCAIHIVRPSSCRGVASVDRAACERAYATRMAEPVPQVRLQGMAADGIGYGLIAGLRDGGYELENLEFNAGLHIALQNSDAGRRWLDGEPVFEPAT